MHAFINPNARQRRYFLTLSIVILLLLVCCEIVFANYAEYYSKYYSSYVNDPNYDSSTEFLTNSSTILLIIGCVMLIVAIAGFIIAWRKKHFLTLHIAISFVILLTCVHGFIMLVHDNTIYAVWSEITQRGVVIQGSAQGSALLVTCAALVTVYFLGFIIKERETDNGKHMLITSGALVLLTLCGTAFHKNITTSAIVIVSLAVFHLLHYCIKMPWYSELIYAGVISFLGVLGLLLIITDYEPVSIITYYVLLLSNTDYELLLILLYDIAVVIITLKMRKTLRMTKTDTALEQLNKLYSSGALTQEEYENGLTKYFGGN